MTVLTTCAINEAQGRIAVTDTYDYDAFGNKINSTGTTPNNYLYRGEQWDSDLGLYYLRARYYNPLTGRFMSRDPNEGTPVIPATLHKYLYTGGDPVNRIDPRGRADEEDEAALDLRSLTKSTEYAAQQLGYTTKILRAAVEALKQANTFAGNPDVWISVYGATIGNVYLQVIEDQKFSYEFLDNLFAYLPE
jgi:RHS repeat-associated protein